MAVRRRRGRRVLAGAEVCHEGGHHLVVVEEERADTVLLLAREPGIGEAVTYVVLVGLEAPEAARAVGAARELWLARSGAVVAHGRRGAQLVVALVVALVEAVVEALLLKGAVLGVQLLLRRRSLVQGCPLLHLAWLLHLLHALSCLRSTRLLS